ncbi:uncharacterized protein BDR25DRAFT_392014 [Lindgomyces ingoldianus]|uniref:Uncharacterized protein n=1 Tax=Lindgomyces ingoldianus TaxID=673940 RepID=A0ACB6R5Y1_9PLEO|nr:uncharacterized protein BDR25DRAFT_392014 [Lindgomyces ingoldianus]KAF2474248.1 hypothetical protein BDR25DRAFT_392014 [Lindgomyces ingoldianus]
MHITVDGASLASMWALLKDLFKTRSRRTWILFLYMLISIFGRCVGWVSIGSGEQIAPAGDFTPGYFITKAGNDTFNATCSASDQFTLLENLWYGHFMNVHSVQSVAANILRGAFGVQRLELDGFSTSSFHVHQYFLLGTFHYPNNIETFSSWNWANGSWEMRTPRCRISLNITLFSRVYDAEDESYEPLLSVGLQYRAVNSVCYLSTGLGYHHVYYLAGFTVQLEACEEWICDDAVESCIHIGHGCKEQDRDRKSGVALGRYEEFGEGTVWDKDGAGQEIFEGPVIGLLVELTWHVESWNFVTYLMGLETFCIWVWHRTWLSKWNRWRIPISNDTALSSAIEFHSMARNAEHARIRMPKPMSEARRERDVLRLYSSAFRDIPYLDQLGPSPDLCFLPHDHVARRAQDSALMGFAQLASIRLGANRALISLIDGQRQHILAEATPDTSLRFDSKLPPGDLWLGNVSIPRTWGACEAVLCIDPTKLATSEDATVIINDLSEHETFRMRSYVRAGPQVRFYIGVALTSPSGAIVGALCIFDDKPRRAVSRPDIIYLTDLATTIVEYLDTYTLRDQYKRGEQMTRGLISFTDGASTLQPFENDIQDPSARPKLYERSRAPKSGIATEPPPRPPPDPPSKTKTDTTSSRTLNGTSAASSAILQSRQDLMQRGKLPKTVSTQHQTVKALQESILPLNSKRMFARAANIMQASSDLDGVLILDASVTATSQYHHGEDTEYGSEANWESALDSKSSSEETLLTPQSSRKTCQILGCATLERPNVAGAGARLAQPSLPEADLTRLFRKFPAGKVLYFTADGEPVSSADESESSGGPGILNERLSLREQQRRKTPVDRVGKTWKAILTALPGARSVAFVPFWDFQRSRWFAGCLCWSNRPDRLLSTQVDLTYFKVFSSSIMNELARLDAIASSLAKTTFVASISHELRSPLHGILGTLRFLQDSPLDSFQISMLNSMAACGQTLLDTLNHVLDYAKINETKRNLSSKRLKGINTIRLSSKPLTSQSPHKSVLQGSAFDLGLATEEVVEAVFAGVNYQPTSSTEEDGPSSPLEPNSEPERTSPLGAIVKRKCCFVVLDVANEEDWIFCVPAGEWRRIVMNVFSNALKYTESGHILVSLRAGDQSNGASTFTHVTLTITDSGSGMSPQFLANKAFQPFSQENYLSPGTGLGLSIVQQIIETIGGKIEVSSDTTKGTKLTIKLALPRPENPRLDVAPRTQFLASVPRLEGRRICILNMTHPSYIKSPVLHSTDEGLKYFADALARTLTNWLKMKVVHTSEWDGHDADIVICPEVSFEYLSAIRQRRFANERAPVTIFVAMDGLEAATLRLDARMTNKESVVEIMTQPCGPYKLASLISHCLDRYESLSENSQFHAHTISSPQSTPDPDPNTPAPPVITEKRWNPSFPLPIPPIFENSPESMFVPNVSSPRLPNQLRTSISNVLIVDDNPINRRLLVAFLKKRSLAHKEATNGLEALRAYQNEAIKFDVILMDISMPVMDGMSATRAIRQYEAKNSIKHAHIIALTGLASASARLEAWSSGVDCFMTKPVDFRALWRALINGEMNGELKGKA